MFGFVLYKLIKGFRTEKLHNNGTFSSATCTFILPYQFLLFCRLANTPGGQVIPFLQVYLSFK